MRCRYHHFCADSRLVFSLQDKPPQLLAASSLITEQNLLPIDGWPKRHTGPSLLFVMLSIMIQARMDNPARINPHGNRHLHASSRRSGISPAALRSAATAEKARILLDHSDASIDTIATQCGFANRAHFASTFQKLSACRQRNGVNSRFQQNTRH